MDEDNSSIPATRKLGTRVSDPAALSPVSPAEPSISSARPDTGSQSKVVPNNVPRVIKEMSASEEESAPKLAWPPTEHDLQQLYLEQKLSAAKIAKVYGRNTKNPRSAAFLITYYLKKYRIERRDRVEELRKDTEAIAEVWNVKHPKVEDGEAPGPVEADDPRLLTDEESAVIELLQNKDLSIRHLELETKARVRVAMEGLHLEAWALPQRHRQPDRKQDQWILLLSIQGAWDQAEAVQGSPTERNPRPRQNLREKALRRDG
jgi:hypothetical protein